MLAQFYIDKKSKKHGKYFQNISKSDMNHLQEYSWPGNIRELKNVIERAVILSENNTLRIGVLGHDGKTLKYKQILLLPLNLLKKNIY